MTEQEAMENLKCYRAQSGTSYPEEIEIAIKALEEIQKYRAIGTPEELKQLKENGAFTGAELAQLAAMQMKLKEYQAIGTPVECRLAVKKQKAKKPDFEGDGYADGHLVYDTWICPCCGKHYEVDYDDYDFCPNCGQKLDWSDEE